MFKFVFLISITIPLTAVHGISYCKDIFAIRNINKFASPEKNKEDGNRNGTTNENTSTQRNQTDLSDSSDFLNVLKKYSDAIEYIASLRSDIRFNQSLTGDINRQTQFERVLREEEFKFLLQYSQDKATAIDKAQDIFIKVEPNWFRLRQIFKDEKEGKTSKFSEEQIQKFKEEFSNNIEEYLYIRSILESFSKQENSEIRNFEQTDAKNPNQNYFTKLNAQNLLNRLGLPTIVSKKDSKYLARPSIEELTDFFKEYPELLTIKVKTDLDVQKERSIKSISLAFLQVEKVQAQILRVVPHSLKPIVGAIFALKYDDYVTKTYLPNIFKVINTPNESKYQRYTVLRTLASEKDTLEFLITFARMSFYTKQWTELKEDAAALAPTNPLYLKFYNQMIKAEMKAVNSKWLNPFYTPALVDHIRKWGGSITFWILITLYLNRDEELKLNDENLSSLNFLKDHENLAAAIRLADELYTWVLANPLLKNEDTP